MKARLQLQLRGPPIPANRRLHRDTHAAAHEHVALLHQDDRVGLGRLDGTQEQLLLRHRLFEEDDEAHQCSSIALNGHQWPAQGHPWAIHGHQMAISGPIHLADRDGAEIEIAISHAPAARGL